MSEKKSKKTKPSNNGEVKAPKIVEDGNKYTHITRQLDQEKIDILSDRTEKLLKSNTILRWVGGWGSG